VGELSAVAERLLALEIELARSFGVTWEEVGAALGVSRQAAWDRFASHERWQKSKRITQLRNARAAPGSTGVRLSAVLGGRGCDLR
jgi:hypothetical protein